MAVANYVDYKTLSERVNNVDYDNDYDIVLVFTEGFEVEEIGSGMFRNLLEFAPCLENLYISVNKKRTDKLKPFLEFEKHPETQFVFLMAIGGDEAPLSGISFLIYF